MNHIQKIIVFLILAFVSIHCYYSFTDEKVENILNPLYWEKPYTYFENQHWIKYGNLELNAFNYEVSILHPNNRFGLTYDIDVNIHYHKNNEKVNIRAKSSEEIANLENIQHIPRNLTDLSLDNYLVKFKEGASLGQIQFHTSLFPSKFLKFTNKQNDKLLINTNPLFLFRALSIKAILFFALIVLSLYFMLGFSELTIFLTISIFLFPFSDYLFWLSLVYFFICSIYMSIKIRHIEYNPLLIRTFKHREILISIAVVIFFVIFAYRYAWQETFSIGLLLEELLSSFVLLVCCLFYIYSALYGVYLLYFHFRYPNLKVDTIRIYNPIADFRKRGEMRRFPRFFCDILVNQNIEIIYANTHMSIYKKLTRNKEIKITHYKTDGKGNYLFY